MIFLPKKPKIISKTPNKAIFEIEALYPGYGITIGNSLRRVLLSSLGGAAVTEVKIAGIPHEFSVIKGVLEDVVLILLNLKKMRFKMYSSEPQKASLKIKGLKKIKASDFKIPPQVEIINKDLHIATLTSKDAVLEMEIQIEKGVGYETIEARKREKLGIGTIALDAIYTPIKKVSFKVQDMRVGERTDYDRLILEIETDATLEPEQAFLTACEILCSHFSLLSKSFAKDTEKERKKETKKEAKEEVKKKAKREVKKKKPARISSKVKKDKKPNKKKSVKK